MTDRRKDNKGRILKIGETQRADGKYQYRFTDAFGNRQCVYSWKLLPSDKMPPEKKEDLSLREKEKEIELKLLQGVNYVGSQMTLNDMFDRYILTKKHKGKKLTQNTIINYTQMWNKHVKDSLLGNMKLVDIKKSDVVYLYETIKEKGLSYGTVLFYHKVITSVFNMAMDDDIISKNPTTRALDNIEGSQKRRTALTVEQQNEFTRSYVNRENLTLSMLMNV